MIPVQNYPQMLFEQAAAMPALVGLVLLAVGLLYAFQGFRFFRFLLMVTCGALGWLAGWALGSVYQVAPDLLALAGCGTLALLSLAAFRPAVLLSCGSTLGALGCYLALSLGFVPLICWLVAGVCFAFGLLFAILCFRTMTVVLTTLQGAGLMVVGFTGIMSRLVPSVGLTFVSWVEDSSMLVPLLIAMVFVTGFSFQASRQQGDIRTGV